MLRPRWGERRSTLKSFTDCSTGAGRCYTAQRLGIQHRFSVANNTWTNGTVERMMREILKTAQAVLNECRRPLSEWIVTVPDIHWALNTSWRKRLGASP